MGILRNTEYGNKAVLGTVERQHVYFCPGLINLPREPVREDTWSLPLMSFTKLLVTSRRLPGTARARAGRDRSCPGVESRSQRIQNPTLELGSGLSYANVFSHMTLILAKH